ncbi:unnamed protein product [Plutella xylostella]|uniref:Angiotensin-converting enzyme n=1 Tax=Plutella xylostella TaxID=51655 RepID=A0A8S4GDR9_PLUXY|nr:unnamed protein product [Plutella xylostella]
MRALTPTFLLLLTTLTLCHKNKINDYFEKINTQFIKHNQVATSISWSSSIKPSNEEMATLNNKYQAEVIAWQHQTCDALAAMQTAHLLNSSQERQAYLLCRGPVYTLEDASQKTELYDQLQSVYSNVQVCIPSHHNNLTADNPRAAQSAILNFIASVIQYNDFEPGLGEKDSVPKVVRLLSSNVLTQTDGFCLNGEEDFQKLMRYGNNEAVLRWLWLEWREKVGRNVKETYIKLVNIENVAAARNGYTDIGAAWREELEIPNLRQKCRELYESIRPLYKLLHGVVRFFLRHKYYARGVPETGPIPAHYLGDLWSQNWESLSDLIIRHNIDVNKNIRKKNWSLKHMAKRAEDFYQSMGLPPMTESFWRNSIFWRQNSMVRCHGTAAYMFKRNDFRLLYCAVNSSDDFYVIHHEMGHIQYYMAYEHQPGIFRQGANSAFHESIGDAIMLGVSSPQHLYRLGLINDTILLPSTPNHPENNLKNPKNHAKTSVQLSTDDILLLKQGLNKIPQIPFALLIDEYRWRMFEGGIDDRAYNKAFWDMARELQGISPPEPRDERQFDIAAKYHVPDNTPYIRYFLSSFLQHQLFEALCRAAVYGTRDVTEDLPPSMAVHRCDIYGSKAAGKVLRDIMSRGTSQHWRNILQETINQDDITSESFIRYYKPLTRLLERLVEEYQIPIGW